MDYQDSDVPPLSGYYFGGLDYVEPSIEPHEDTHELRERLEVMRAAMRAEPVFGDEVPLFYDTPPATTDDEAPEA